ncbi:hypothetical protein HRbin30_02985 [bacterium HR30]|nr:hypothetical protein HRbin30_02985 [bacterium HR30]
MRSTSATKAHFSPGARLPALTFASTSYDSGSGKAATCSGGNCRGAYTSLARANPTRNAAKVSASQGNGGGARDSTNKLVAALSSAHRGNVQGATYANPSPKSKPTAAAMAGVNPAGYTFQGYSKDQASMRAERGERKAFSCNGPEPCGSSLCDPRAALGEKLRRTRGALPS